MQDFRKFLDKEWQQTPDSVKATFLQIEKAYQELFNAHGVLQTKSEKQEIRIGKNSGNSDNPPSTDSPYKKNIILIFNFDKAVVYFLESPLKSEARKWKTGGA